jgi:cysteine desulfurase/selenocysteine lyase
MTTSEHLDPGSPGLPAGLPDIALLTQLANQFFSAPPSSAPAVIGGGAPTLPSGFSPTLPSGLPSGLPTFGRAPAQSAAGFPAAPVNAPASKGPAVPDAFGSGLPLGSAAPQGFGLPTEAQLQQRLAPRFTSPAAIAPALTAAAPSFYFLEQQRIAVPVNVPVQLTPSLAQQAAVQQAAVQPTFGGFPAPDAGASALQSRGSDLLKVGAAPAGFGLAGEGDLAALFTPDLLSTKQFGGDSAGRVHPPLSGQQAGHQLGHQAGHQAGAPFDIHQVRRDFPILQERVNGRQLVWLDNAATTQKPQCVIDRLAYFYQHENSNIHRAAHELAARATDAYEGAREKVRAFMNAASPNEIVFVRGATEAINLVAQSWGRQHIGKDDEIIISWLEHHANIVPWQQLCAQTGAKLNVIPVDDDGQILLDEYAKLLGPRTRLVSFTHVSNALGTVTPAKQMTAMAHAVGARVLVDGAQAVSHLRTDVQALACDWYVFSGHKVFGPTGIGVLYGKEALLNATQPWQGGGNMIKDVTFEHTEYHQAPGRFEAGTGNIADAVGLGAAIDYVTKIGIDNIAHYEHQLLLYATAHLKTIPGLRLIGTAPDKASVVSFVLDGFKTEQVGAALSKEGIAVRSGHHCAQPILRRFGLESSVRPSLAFYNNCADVDALVAAVRRISSGRQSF